MNSQFRKEKQDIQKIINEIDSILFDNVLDSPFYKDEENKICYPFIGLLPGMFAGMVTGVCIDVIQGSHNNVAPVAGIFIGGVVGLSIVSIIEHYLDKSTNHFNSYESAYLSLSREQQLQVLKLSKKLVKYYEKIIKSDKGKQYLEKYLYLDNCSTMFNKFENNHPQFKLLSKEKIDDIHSKGKITPLEKYNELVSMEYCPGSEIEGWDCNKYDNCRDCKVSYVNEKEEWDSIFFKLDDEFKKSSFQKTIAKNN